MMSSAVQAEQKIGVVNVEGIFQSMPQAATIRETIAAEFKDRTEEVTRLQKDIKYYIETYEREAATMSDKQKKELEEKITGLRVDFEAKAKPLQEETQRRAQEEQGKLVALIRQGIEVVSAKGKYDLILNAGAVAFIKPDSEHDISKSVIEQLAKVK